MDLLACPACLGGLRFDKGKMVCAQCGRIYPIVDGIPALIAERAIESNRSK
ncbi:MAG: Trm112 family protein [Terracidiphilus sp.]